MVGGLVVGVVLGELPVPVGLGELPKASAQPRSQFLAFVDRPAVPAARRSTHHWCRSAWVIPSGAFRSTGADAARSVGARDAMAATVIVATMAATTAATMTGARRRPAGRSGGVVPYRWLCTVAPFGWPRGRWGRYTKP